MPNSSKPEPPTAIRSVQGVFHRGGSILVLPAANPKGPPRTCGSFTLARPCLRLCSTLRTLLFAVLHHVSCRKQSWLLPSFDVAQRCSVDVGAAVYFILQRQHHRTEFLVSTFFLPITDWFNFHFSPPDIDRPTFLVFFCTY